MFARGVWLGAGALLLSGCGYFDAGDANGVARDEPMPAAGRVAPAVEPTLPAEAATTAPATPATPATTAPATPAAQAAPTEPPRPGPRARAQLSIPAIGLAETLVVAYRGTPDDGPGTVIQDRSYLASPRGGGGTTGPGEIGNFIVTGHRTSHGAPFGDLPGLRNGERVTVRSAGWEFVYEITDTRRTSFRSARSLLEQSAAVPGRPDEPAVEAMITLSTCRTQEDHAEGNYWSDEFGNPEHRIDKIGVLVETVPPVP